MLKSLFDAICAKQLEAVKPTTIDVADPFAKHFFFDGKIARIEVPPAARKHTVFTLDDLIASVKHHNTDLVKGSIWHDRTKVVFLIDDEDRREMVTLPLVFSDHWDILCKLPAAMTQRDFVRLLRHELAGCVPDTLLPAIAKIEVATSSGQRNEINPGRERGSREFAVDLANSGEIPESFLLAVSVYSTPGLRQCRCIKMSLDYTLPPSQVTFQVTPRPDEIEIAMQDAQAELHKLLCDAVECPVFNGNP